MLMRTFIAVLVGAWAVASAHAQLDPTQPEKTVLAAGSTPGTYTFTWNSQPNRTYFIQQSDDLATWVYLPVVEYGDGLDISYGLSSTSDRIFWRLRYSASATYSDDADNDGLSDADELALGRDPLKPDAFATGIPDGWAAAYAGKLSVYPPQIRQTIASGQTATASIYLSNGTAQPVDFQVSVAGQETTSIDYIAADSLTGSATYTWTDISTTGTNLTAISSADDAATPVTLTQFVFPFYGQNLTTIYASSNGLLSFGSANIAYTNTLILSANNSSPIIAGFWDDLDTNYSGDVYYQELSDRAIFQYEQVGFHGGSGTVTFQIVLHSNGVIDLFYKELTGTALSSTLGIANTTGTGQGLQIAYNQAYVTGGLAVKISPVPPGVSATPTLTSGTLPANSILKVDVLLNALATLSAGLHNATLGVTFNRANTPVWLIPVTIEIPGAGLPVITLVEPASARRID